MELQIEKLKQEIVNQTSNPETLATLMETTFKGLNPSSAKRAMLEAMITGFTFKDFLQKNIYAVPFGQNYALVTSIDYARKIGMRSGVCGKSAPVFEEQDGKLISCTVTVKRKINDYIGDYSATVFMNEYSTGKLLWQSKPRTMLSKVAEVHALRMACPEELSQTYIEEEYAQNTEKFIETEEQKEQRKLECVEKLEATFSLEELKNVWANIPGEFKKELESLKDELKYKFSNGNFVLEPNSKKYDN